MIQIFADGVLTYDSRLEDYDLHGLRITTGLGKGGTAEIVMPASHPAYSAYVEYRTVVEIYRDGDLRFRGRALYPEDDYYNNRTVVCEGELCFLRDGVLRPHTYEGSPADIFAAVVGEYNAQVEPFKRFKLGAVRVAASRITLVNEEAEKILSTVNKLTQEVGGYIVFTTDAGGTREINWLTDISSTNQQTIEAGENLFDFSRSGANTDLATAIIPYGAKNEQTGERVTVKSVNSRSDIIIDEEAVVIRGTIVTTVTWDDITDPAALYEAARQYLNQSKLVVTSLTLTALDLSYVDKDIESFKLGDYIRVISRAHRVDGPFQLVELTEDLLNPAQSFITLGKELRTLTSLDVAGDNNGQRTIQRAVASVKSDYKADNRQITQALLEGFEQTYAKVSALTALEERLKALEDAK